MGKVLRREWKTLRESSTSGLGSECDDGKELGDDEGNEKIVNELHNEIVFQSKSSQMRIYIVVLVYPVFCSRDPMTLICELDLDILKIYMCTKNELCMSNVRN